MHRAQRLSLSLFLLASLFATLPCFGQIPGVLLVHTLSGADAGAKIQTCLDTLAAEVPQLGGTCDARGLRGGAISSRILVEVPNVRIVLGPGTFTVSGGVAGFQIRAENTILEGQGPATHLDAGTRTGNRPVIEVFDDVGAGTVRNARILDLKVSGNKDAEFVSLVRVKLSEDVLVRGIEARRGGGGAIVVTDSSRVQVLDNRIDDMYKHGIVVTEASTYCDIVGNRIDDVGQIADMGISGSGGITIVGGNVGSPSYVKAIGNSVSKASAGIRVTTNQGVTPTDVLIAGNSVDRARLSATVEGEGIATSGDNVQILGNRVDGARVNGILVWGAGRKNITVADNMVSNSSLEPLTNHNAINLNTQNGQQERILVVDNLGYDDQANPSQKHLLACNVGTSGSVKDLFADGNVNGGFGVTALSSCAQSFAVTSGNVQ